MPAVLSGDWSVPYGIPGLIWVSSVPLGPRTGSALAPLDFQQGRKRKGGNVFHPPLSPPLVLEEANSLLEFVPLPEGQPIKFLNGHSKESQEFLGCQVSL